MKKWTTTGLNGRGATLAQILDARQGGPLNEVECWALLGQAGLRLAEKVANNPSAPGGHHHQTLEEHKSRTQHPHQLVVTPDRLFCTSLGRVVISGAEVGNVDGFLPSKADDCISLSQTTLGMYSLAKTVLRCLSPRPDKGNLVPQPDPKLGSPALSLVLERMMSIEESAFGLADLQVEVAANWARTVGKTPASRYIGQLAKFALGWTNDRSVNFRSQNDLAMMTTHPGDYSSFPAPKSTIGPVDGDGGLRHTFPDKEATDEQDVLALAPLRSSSPIRQQVVDFWPGGNSINNNENDVPRKSGTEQEGLPHAGHHGQLGAAGKDGEAIGNSAPISSVVRQPPTTTMSFEKGQYGRRLEFRPGAAVVLNPSQPQPQALRMSSLSTAARTTRTTGGYFPAKLATGNQANRQPDGLKPMEVDASSAEEACNRTTRKVPQRNPSRLYRIVKPLAEVSPVPSPATKRCVGPEFVVMSMESQSVRIDLSSCHSKKDLLASSKNFVEVLMLNGQKIVLQVNCNGTNSLTVGDILDNVMREQDLKETSMFALAIYEDGEYLPVSNDIKLTKIAPKGWKENPQGSVTSGDHHGHHRASSVQLFPQQRPFILHLRFRFLPNLNDPLPDLFKLRDPTNKHLFYLQLRKDVLDNRYRLTTSQHLSLAGMALQVEFGDFYEEIHGGGGGDYFFLEHYLPKHAVYELGMEECRVRLVRLHRAHLGQSQTESELRFCREVQRLDTSYGFHLFKAGKDKPDLLLGVHVDGIFQFKAAPTNDLSKGHSVLSAFHWNRVTRIQYDKTKFVVLVAEPRSDQGQGNKKYKFYMSELKAKMLFDLASGHHQFSNRQRQVASSTVDVAAAAAEVGGTEVEYRGPAQQNLSSSIRSLKSRFFMSRRNLSQRKLYTSASSATPSDGGGGVGLRLRSRSQSRDRTLGGANAHLQQPRRRSGGSSFLAMRRSGTAVALESPVRRNLRSQGLEDNPSSQPGASAAATAAAQASASGRQQSNYLVRRLAHYTSMADALMEQQQPVQPQSAGQQQPPSSRVSRRLDTSDKENSTPEGNYRYKVYLEPEEDENPDVRRGHRAGQTPGHQNQERRHQSPKRLPLQEKPVSSLYPEAAEASNLAITPLTSKMLKHHPRLKTVNPANHVRGTLEADGAATSKVKTRRSGVVTASTVSSSVGGGDAGNGGNSVLRMGTRISLSALHRERLRLTSEMGGYLPIPGPPITGTSSRSSSSSSHFVKRIMAGSEDVDMEFKSLPRSTSGGVRKSRKSQGFAFAVDSVSVDEQHYEPYQFHERGLSDSLLERFDAMETEESEPERQIVSVTVLKDENGRLGLKITGTPSGIYVEDFDQSKLQLLPTQTAETLNQKNTLKPGDRIVAINGRSLENVSYTTALDLIRKSDKSVQFMVSQVRSP